MPAGGGEVLPPPRDFKATISRPGRLCLIAEIKFASPSAGVIRERADPSAIGRVYQEAGAAAISFITDQRFFGGRLEEDVRRVKETGQKPVAVGFGISTPEQAKEVSRFADGVIVGSAVLRIVEEIPDKEEMIARVGDFIDSLGRALRLPC